jgi:transposase
VAALDEELKANSKQLTELVNRSPARVLLEQPGVGPVTAAVALAAWSHHGRVRNGAAFASLAGVSRSQPPQATPSVTGSTAAATDD